MWATSTSAVAPTATATATPTASKQEALEEHYRPSTHGKSCRAAATNSRPRPHTPSPTYAPAHIHPRHTPSSLIAASASGHSYKERAFSGHKKKKKKKKKKKSALL